jgi:sortase A
MTATAVRPVGFPTPEQLAAVYGTSEPAAGPARLDRPAAPGTEPAITHAGTALRAVATVMILVAGMALVGGAAWQMWGSNWMAERRQAELARQLEQSPAMLIPAGITLAQLSATEVPPPVMAPPPAAPGNAVGTIRAGAIGLDVVFVAGTDTAALKAGPGLMDGTAFPGDAGNSVISGHRSTYGSPFYDLDKLAVGDRITVSVPGRPDAVYEVRDNFLVMPGDVWVAAPTEGARLTLTTCNPVGSDRERLIVQAELVEGPAASSAVPAASWQRSTPA